MSRIKFLFGGIFILSCLCTRAAEIKDTLKSKHGDWVSITYNITKDDGHFDIEFREEYVKLCPSSKNKYRKLDEIVVLFFDKIGGYNDGTEFSGIDFKAFIIPNGTKYMPSNDGYYLLNNNSNSYPRLSLNLASVDSAELKIPIYLAHYDNKLSYKVFSDCGNLNIKLSKKKSQKSQNTTSVRQVTDTVTTTEEVESVLTEEDDARINLGLVNELLEKQVEYPFSDDLNRAISDLRRLKYVIKDSKIISEIEELLGACELKEKDLKAAKIAAEIAKAKEDSIRLAEEEARNDSIADAEKLNNEKEKERNMWLIIGVVILAVIGFIFNQIFQNYRDKKKQKNTMAMQEDLRKRAENEAKRRARNMTQNQINRAKGEVRRQTRNTINACIGKIKQSSKKGISI